MGTQDFFFCHWEAEDNIYDQLEELELYMTVPNGSEQVIASLLFII
jgi:hypothetical protein